MTDYYTQIEASDEREDAIDTDQNDRKAERYDFSDSRTWFNLDEGDYEDEPLNDLYRSDGSVIGWDDLLEYQNGKGGVNNTRRNLIGTYRTDLKQICSTLDCSHRQRKYAFSLVTKLDLRFKPGDSIEDALLGIGLYVADYAIDDALPEKYTAMVAAYGSDMDTIERVIDTLHDQPERKSLSKTRDCVAAGYDGELQTLLSKYAIDRIDTGPLFDYVEEHIDDDAERDELYAMIREMDV